MIAIPTLNQLYTSILSDLETQYGNTISPVGKVFLRALAGTQAAKLKLFYLTLGNLQKNIFADTAESESIGGTLERFGRVKLGRNPYKAVSGIYTVTVTGTIGGIIPASTTFKSDDTSLSPGYLFVLDNAHTMVSTSDTITLRALNPGTVSKINVGDTLTSTAPIALVDSVATVSVISTAPLEAETLEAYRSAILNSYRLEPQGGAATDYRIWASDAQGVQRVYPYAKSGAVCEIDLYVEATLADSTDGKGTPTPQILLDVESVVNFNPDTNLDQNERGRRPLQVIVNYLPVTIRTVNINISSSSFTVSQKALLLSAITNSINEIRPFVDGADDLNLKNNILDSNKIIGVIISQVPGAIFGAITIEVDSVVVPTYTFELGDIPYLNTVTYV